MNILLITTLFSTLLAVWFAYKYFDLFEFTRELLKIEGKHFKLVEQKTK